MTIRLLHTADLHLDSPLRSLAVKDARLAALVRRASRQVLEDMVQFCIDEGIAALLIAGDLYDGQERSARTAAYLAGQLQRLNEAGTAVYYIKGNHDAENPVAGEIDLPPNVHVFDGRGGKVQLGDHPVWIHGVSFRDRHAPDSLLTKYPSPEPSAVNIGLMHTSLTGAAGHDPYAPCSVADLQGAGFDYWALGHVHKRQVQSSAPFVVMPGMPQGRDIGEAGPKSATVLTIDEGRITLDELPTSLVEFRHLDCALDGVANDDDLRTTLRASLRGVAGQGNLILRLRLTGQTDMAWRLRQLADGWQAELEAMAEQIGGLWIEKLVIDAVPPDAARPAAPSADAIEEVQALMAQIRAEPGFVNEARQEMEQVLALLPADRRSGLAPDQAAQDALLDRLSAEAALTMAARMRGQGT